MLEGETILAFGDGQWQFRRTDQQMLQRLASTNQVVYVERQASYEVFAQKGKLDYLRAFHGVQRLPGSEDVIVLKSTPMLPGTRAGFFPTLLRAPMTKILARTAKAILTRHVSNFLRANRLRPTVVWVTHPFDVYLLGRFGEELDCYYVFDEYDLFPANRFIQSAIRTLDWRCCARADLVFASSVSQYEKRAQYGRAHLVPNGVDFEHFSRAARQQLAMPRELVGLKPPIVGYVGGIDFRIDFHLYHDLVKQHPDWTFVLIGPHSGVSPTIFQNIIGRNNVHWFGPKPFEDIPAYLQRFDVAIIPFVTNAATNTMSPIKLYEYLAAGKPVVATELAEVKLFSDVVSVAGSVEDFHILVERELGADDTTALERRIEVARLNSIEQRVNVLSELMAHALAGKRSKA